MWFKSRVGWLSEAAGDIEVVDVGQPTGTGYSQFQVRRIDLTPDSDLAEPQGIPTALRIPRDDQTDVWLFYRGDKGPKAEGQTPGVVLTWGSHTNAMPSRLLDMRPDSLTGGVCLSYSGSTCTKFVPHDALDADLAPGEEVVDDFEGGLEKLYFRCDSVDGTNATVSIRIPESIDIDGIPVIDVVAPIAGETVGGTQVDYEVIAYDPDCGPNPIDGRGIYNLRLELANGSDDAVITALQSGDPLPAAGVIYCKDFGAPPYAVELDTADTTGNPSSNCSAGNTTVQLDGHYFLVVTATAFDGGVNRVVVKHLMVNTPPSGS